MTEQSTKPLTLREMENHLKEQFKQLHEWNKENFDEIAYVRSNIESMVMIFRSVC